MMLDISAAEVLRSFAVELAIFAGTLVVAVVFKWTGVLNDKAGKSKQSSLMQKCAQMGEECHTEGHRDDHIESHSKGTHVMPGPRQSDASRPKQKPMPVSRELARLVDTMIECGNRRQATDALAMYEELRGIGQLRVIKEQGARSKQSAAGIYAMLVQCVGRVNRPELIDMLISDMRRLDIERPLSFYESTMK